MKALLKIFTVTFLFVLTNNLMGQASFHIKYHIKFINENGSTLTCDSLAKDSLYIDTYPGHLVKHEYDTLSKYFFIDIYTIWPLFTLIWKKNNKKMTFTIDCPTEYKEIYLDSLYFNSGSFLVSTKSNNCDKNIIFEDASTRHIVFSDYFNFKQNSVIKFEREDFIYDINCW